MNKEDEKNLLACLGIVFGIILIPVMVIFQGWVLTILWGWFIVPTFRAPELSIPVAIGLTLIVGMFKSYNTKQESTEEKLTSGIATILIPLFLLFIGWIVHLFM